MDSDDDQYNFSKLGFIALSLKENNKNLSNLKKEFTNLIAALFISFSCIGLSGLILLLSSIISLPTLIVFVIVDALFIEIISHDEVEKHIKKRKKMDEIIKMIKEQEELNSTGIEPENTNFDDYKKENSKVESEFIDNEEVVIIENRLFKSYSISFHETTPLQKVKKYFMN